MHIKEKLEQGFIQLFSFSLGVLCVIVFFINNLSANTFTNQDNHIVVSPIGDQEVMVGAGISIYFTAFDPVIGSVSFSSTDLPSFGEIINNGDNTGKILINTQLGQEGDYLFHLSVSGTTGTTIVPIHLTVLERIAGGRVFYSDPVNGNMSNTGDSLNPWGSLQNIFSSNTTLEDGDIIFLRDGYHGRPEVLGKNDENIYIVAQAGHTPAVRRLTVVFAENWVISGLEISPESAGMTEKGDYLKLVANAQNIIVENCHIYAIKNSSIWTENQDWYDNCGNGILNKGKYVTIRNNLLTNTYFSVTVDASFNHFDYNIIDRFGGDAIRGIKSYNSFNYNTVINAVVDDYDLPPPVGNHDDAFQSWTFSTPIKSIEIIGNLIFSCTDPDLPLKTSIMQGIVIFDGFAEDWIVSNNLVVLDHPHGIALFGAKNCKVVNNTVIRNPLELFFYGSHPWVRINPHKDGRLSTGNLVRNNLSGTISLDQTPGTADHNTVSTAYNTFFNDYPNWDFYLKESATVINTGLADDAPEVDLDHLVRVPTDNIDRGCFERDAAIFDVEKPSPANNLEVVSISSSSVHLSWTPATDNIYVSHYEVRYDDKVHTTTDTDAFIYGLKDDSNYDFELTAVDYAGNVSFISSISASTEPKPADSPYQLLIPADRHDQQIRSNNKLEWVGLYEHQIGGITASYNTSAVIPFKLPKLEDWEEVKSAKLHLNYKRSNNTPQSGIDLYGLTARAKSDVSPNDHWQGSFSSGSNGIGLIQNYINPISTFGILPVNETSVEIISTYINHEYEQGANEGDYIFFRLNANIENENADTYFVVSSENEPRSINRPYLELTIGLKPNATFDTTFDTNDLNVAPNPIGADDYLRISIPEALQQEQTVLRIFDFMGRELYREFLSHAQPETNLNLGDLKLTNGIYQINLKGASFTAQVKLIIN